MPTGGARKRKHPKVDGAAEEAAENNTPHKPITAAVSRVSAPPVPQNNNPATHLRKGFAAPEDGVFGPSQGMTNAGRQILYRPVCFYSHKEHSGELFCVYSSNDNDLSCIERKPEFETMTADNPYICDIMMFESFSEGWGPVACYAGTNEIFAYISDKDDTVRGLLSSCHTIKGSLAWDSVVPVFGSGVVAMGRVVYKSSNCPGPLLPSQTNPTATQRYQDNSITSPEQQDVGGRRYRNEGAGSVRSGGGR